MTAGGTLGTHRKDGLEFEMHPAPAGTGIGTLLHDPAYRLMVEDAVAQLQLLPVLLDAAALNLSQLEQLELIVTEEWTAPGLHSLLARRTDQYGKVPPAIVVVRHPDLQRDGHRSVSTRTAAVDRHFDGSLDISAGPAQIAAQLGLVLYGHRTFARRSRSSLDELDLNRRIFHSLTSGVSVADARLWDTPLVYINPAFERMTGYTLDEMAGKNCRILHRGEEAQPGLSPIRAALKSGTHAVSVLRNFRKDGTPFWNELVLSSIRNRDGELTHFVGIQNDVTARVQLEAALRESEKLAAVGRLAASIAHEINNPLESVMNLLYLAQQASDQAEMKDFLTLADQELKRVALITSQSLRFYKQSTRAQSVLPMDLVDSVLDVYGSLIRNAGIVVERKEPSLRGPKDATRIACFDSEVRQVIGNLVRNAVDAMYITGGRLLVRVRPATSWRSGALGVCITIADTGSGISPEDMKHLHKPFFTTKGAAGTGLGLWISSEIVARHQGHVCVRSSQRARTRGTVFQLFLPFQKIGA